MAESLPAPAPPRLPAALAGPLARLRANPLAVRAALPALAAATVGLLVLGWLLFAPPERTPLYRQLPESDKAAVVAALEEAGLDVALDPKTGDVLLPADDHARARMLLAAGGLPRAAPGGADLLADMPLGTSRAMEGARLKSAQERELARSIESLKAVATILAFVLRVGEGADAPEAEAPPSARYDEDGRRLSPLGCLGFPSAPRVGMEPPWPCAGCLSSSCCCRRRPPSPRPSPACSV